jgi:hypothetical protein
VITSVLKECIAFILQFQVLAHLIVGSKCSTFLSNVGNHLPLMYVTSQKTGICTYTAVKNSKLDNLFSSNCSGFKSK